jgi:hypothetical protein
MIGQTGALNYQIPLRQGPGYQSDPMAQQQLAPVEAPQTAQLPDRLAVMEGKTKELYDNYALLDSFSRDMASKGIDVFKPDYSQEGGGLPFQTYQKLEAMVRFAANDLSNEQRARDASLSDFQRGNIQFAKGKNYGNASVQDPNNIVSNMSTYQIEEANRRTNENTYTPQHSAAVNATAYDPTIAAIDEQVANGEISQEQGERRKEMVFRNVNGPAYQQLIPRGGRKGPTPEDISRRADLIKQMKVGIYTNDQTALNILRNAPGVEYADYVDDGSRLGIEVGFKGADPSFIDLSTGAGEGEINAMLSRITGQLKIPNEALFDFDTNVGIPQSNSGVILQGLKEKMKSIPSKTEVAQEILPTLQQMAAEGTLQIPDGVVMSIDLDEPNFISQMWRDGNRLTIKYHPVVGGKVQATTKEKVVSSPEELESIISHNAQLLAPKFGSQIQRAGETSQQITPVDFNTQWSKLKPGERLTGPDGKIYIKK